jgi:hypothetical protein
VISLRGMLTTSYFRALPIVTQINTRKMKVVKRKFSIQVLIRRGVSGLIMLKLVGESSSLFRSDLRKMEHVP